MRTPIFGALFLTVLAPALADGQEPIVDREKLRRLVRLPPVSTHMALVDVHKNRKELRSEIQAIEATIKAGKETPENRGDLFLLYSELKEPELARKHLNTMIKLLREQLKKDTNSAALFRLASVLSTTDQRDESERALRQAIELSPEEPIYWRGLGKWLKDKALLTVVPDADLAQQIRLGTDLLNMLAQKKIEVNKSKAEEAVKSLKEAAAAFDKAIELDPKDGDAYFERSKFRAFDRDVGDGIRMLTGGKMDIIKIGIGDDALADLRKACELAKDEPYWLAELFRFDFVKLAMEKRLTPEKGRFRVWNTLADKDKAPLENTLAKLQKLSEHKHAWIKRAALENLGLIYYLLVDDVEKATSCYQRAIELEPATDAAIDGLHTLCGAEGNRKCFEAVGNAAHEQAGSAHAHLLFAKHFAALEKWKEAEKHARAAVAAEPKDALAQLTLAIVLIKQPFNLKKCDEATELFKSASSRLKEQPSKVLADHLKVAFAATLAMFEGFDEAHSMLEGVIDPPGDPYAEELVKLLPARRVKGN